ncbi:MAG: hypothetical protein ISR64_10340 [Deltaproteobacteria bacterium]|nr:hypothetical protein [Deltaproteobacteria bacterium]
MGVEDLVEAVHTNFEGHLKTSMLMRNKASKYGNDDDEADAVARDLHRFWTLETARHESPATGKQYRSGYLSWNYWVCYGPRTAATPDGRARGRFVSNGSCPVTGKDRKGPTANTRSVGKLASFLRAYNEEGGTACSSAPATWRDRWARWTNAPMWR